MDKQELIEKLRDVLWAGPVKKGHVYDTSESVDAVVDAVLPVFEEYHGTT